MKKFLTILLLGSLASGAFSLEGTPVAPNFIAPEPTATRTIKEVRPAPGMYCHVVRPFNSYEEIGVVAATRDSLKLEFIKGCLKKLPKHFTVITEVAPLILVDDYRIFEYETFQCSYTKQANLPGRFSLKFVFVHLITDDLISDCFNKAFRTPNIARKTNDA